MFFVWGIMFHLDSRISLRGRRRQHVAVWEEVKSPPVEGRGISPVRGPDGALGKESGAWGGAEGAFHLRAAFPGDGWVPGSKSSQTSFISPLTGSQEVLWRPRFFQGIG